MARTLNKEKQQIADIRRKLFAGETVKSVATSLGIGVASVQAELDQLVAKNIGQASRGRLIPEVMLAVTQAEFVAMISRYTIHGYIRDGRIEAKPMGGRSMILSESLREFLEKSRPRGVAGQKALHGKNWKSSYAGERPHRQGMKYKKK